MGNPFLIQETTTTGFESVENSSLDLLSVMDPADMKGGASGGKDQLNQTAAGEIVPPLEIDFGKDGLTEAGNSGDSPSATGAGVEEFVLDVAMDDLLQQCGRLGPDAAACVKSVRRHLS